jgi:hypothetical protein
MSFPAFGFTSVRALLPIDRPPALLLLALARLAFQPGHHNDAAENNNEQIREYFVHVSHIGHL